MNNDKTRRSGLKIMLRLIGLVKPLLPIMLLAILLGVIGYLCAIFLTILAAGEIVKIMEELAVISAGSVTGILTDMTIKSGCVFLVVMGVARGFLHYGEQYCNHFIAFKLLAILRHKVFAALRRLCPAKLEGSEKGNLISLITSDVELLEVFYAHTISPIAIAIIISVFMTIFIGSFHWMAGVLAAVAYLVVGALLPLTLGKKGADAGMRYREKFGALNSYVLDSLHGIDETIQYHNSQDRKEQIIHRSEQLGQDQKQLNLLESMQRSATNLLVLVFSLIMLIMMIGRYQLGEADFSQVFLATVSMMGSFGPVIALSNLSNNLNQTLACGERVLHLLEEEPQVEEVPGDDVLRFDEASAGEVTFAYEKETILKDFSFRMKQGQIIGIHGPSGCGKSTLLKLLMRFWDVQKGEIVISGKNIKTLPTGALRRLQTYVTQETYLFHDTIANNISLGNPNVTRQQIINAAKKASIHETILSFPDGYDTMVGELGTTLSGGERQRIGIARAFLSDSEFWLLDEPTSNLDALNEGIILKSLKEHAKKRSILLVSHRRSTLNIADEIFEMSQGRIS
ncbi:MAG: ABC transporter ATP-binding protein/permease [Eubacterium sp.]|nr:ABC transporter ATP-binding protein/permease [Eubacterium sp.]